jgi:hypothetical protein
VVSDQRGGGAYGKTYQPHVEEKGTQALSVVAALTTITACVVSCVILVAALTRLVKASTRLLLAVAEFQQALDNFEKNRQTKSRSILQLGFSRLLVAYSSSHRSLDGSVRAFLPGRRGCTRRLFL